MSNFRFALAVSLTLSTSAGVVLADPPTSPANSASVSQSDPDRMVCRVQPAKTGSRIGATRECHSQREWERMQQEQRNMITKLQIQRGTTGN